MESKLKKIRQERGISQEKCARDIGISVRTLQRYENGEYNATIYSLAQLSKYFNVSIEELLPDNSNTQKKDDFSNEENFK